MKLIIWHLDSANKPSSMSEGVTEIWINSQACKGINLTTWHTLAWGHHEWQPFTTWPKSRARSYLTLVPSSTRMPRRTHRGWPRALSHCTPVKQGKVSSNSSTNEATQFRDSICPYASVHFKYLFIRTQPMWALIDTGGGYHLGVPKLWSRPLSTFPSSILHFPLIALPGLQLCQPFHHLAKPHRTSIDRKDPIVSRF
jgi:hypothetical protein